MTLFLSTFVNKVDKKGRVSVPASFRSALLGESFQGIVVFRSHVSPALECCAMSRMEQLSGSVDTLDLFSETRNDWASVLFADALQLPFDGDGRMILPKSFLDFLTCDEALAFVGRGSTFQIWHPQTFERHQEEARIRMRDKAGTLTLRLADAPQATRQGGEGAP